MEYFIRRSRIEDAEALAKVHARSWEAAYEGILLPDAIKANSERRFELWNRILSDDSKSIKITAVIDGVVSGFMVMDDCKDPDLKDKVLEIVSLYFLPEYWGKGYAKHMIDFAVNHAKRNRYYALSLWVLENNPRARRFYEKCDFFFDGNTKKVTIGEEVTEVRYWNTLMGREVKWWRLI